MNKDIALAIETVANEILFSLDQKLQEDIRGDILTKLINDEKLKDQITARLSAMTNELIDMLEYRLHKIASGQEKIAGARTVAGFFQPKK